MKSYILKLSNVNPKLFLIELNVLNCLTVFCHVILFVNFMFSYYINQICMIFDLPVFRSTHSHTWSHKYGQLVKIMTFQSFVISHSFVVNAQWWSFFYTYLSLLKVCPWLSSLFKHFYFVFVKAFFTLYFQKDVSPF